MAPKSKPWNGEKKMSKISFCLKSAKKSNQRGDRTHDLQTVPREGINTATDNLQEMGDVSGRVRIAISQSFKCPERGLKETLGIHLRRGRISTLARARAGKSKYFGVTDWKKITADN
jgi:hypothetical protein